MPHDRPSRRLPLRALVLAGCLLLATSGCLVEGLNFVEDTRVRITAPEDRAEVQLPVTVTWDVTDFEVTEPGEAPRRAEEGEAGYFGVFVDRTPQPPGETLEWLARDDGGCVAVRGCPDEEWLTQRRIYTTTDTSFTIEQLPSRDDGRRERHEVVIILLDPEGRRIGESAFHVEFEVVRST